MANIRAEGLGGRNWLTGDIMVDAIYENIDRARSTSTNLEQLGLESESYALLTLHRPY